MMKYLAGLLLFATATYFYVRIWELVSELVREANAVGGRRFNRFFWQKAWPTHRRNYLHSGLRRKIVQAFVVCWAFMVLALSGMVFGLDPSGWHLPPHANSDVRKALQ